MAATRKYPWEVWLARPRTVLVRGVHYHCSQSTMTQTIRNNACARGVRVRLRDTGNAVVVEVVGESTGGMSGEVPGTNTTPVPR